MLKFKSPKGNIVEVTEEFAEQVLRPQGKYEEIFPVEEKIVIPKVTKKKAKKKTKVSK